MNTIRRALAILVLIAAILMGVRALLVPNSATLANTIRNHEITNAQFKKASLLVDDFLERNQRLPTSQEMQGASPDFEFIEIQSDVTTFPPWAEPEAISIINRELTEMGSPPVSTKRPYLLVEWGVDIPLFWSSWAQRSNAYTDPARFYTLGTTSTYDVMLYATASFLLLFSALLLWRWTTPAINTDVAR